MDNTKRKDCPCPQGHCLAMTSDVFRCRGLSDAPAAMPARPFNRTDLAVEYVRKLAEDTVRIANVYGVVLTIENKPLQPLAMGHYESVVDVRVKK